MFTDIFNVIKALKVSNFWPGLKFYLLIALLLPEVLVAQRARDHGIEIGILKTGPNNAITDVAGVKVGQVTIQDGNINTGVTAILPHDGNIFQQKVPAAIYLGNGFGKLAGYSQVEELGNLETPIALTNTLSVPDVSRAVMRYVLAQEGNESVRSVNPVVGETNDGRLNDIRGMHVSEEHVWRAISEAKTGPVVEGTVGAGTGTICFGYKGGIGTSSRKLPAGVGGYTVGVLVQTNYGGVLEINGAPIAKELGRYPLKGQIDADGSCMIVVATDAPLDARNLKRLAKRAMLGLGKTGGIASNGSGDYVIAFSTATGLRVPYSGGPDLLDQQVLSNDWVTPLFIAAIEATEEAIINSLFAATAIEGTAVETLPKQQVLDILRKHNKLKKP